MLVLLIITCGIFSDAEYLHSYKHRKYCNVWFVIKNNSKLIWISVLNVKEKLKKLVVIFFERVNI